MNRRLRTLLLAILLPVLALIAAGLGYLYVPRTVPVSQFQPPYRIEVRKVGGRTITAYDLDSHSPEERAVSRWLQDHSHGWQPNFVTYVPIRVIRGDGFNLNYLKGICVLNYQLGPNGGWSQVSRPIEDSNMVPDIFNKIQ